MSYLDEEHILCYFMYFLNFNQLLLMMISYTSYTWLTILNLFPPVCVLPETDLETRVIYLTYKLTSSKTFVIWKIPAPPYWETLHLSWAHQLIHISCRQLVVACRKSWQSCLPFMCPLCFLVSLIKVRVLGEFWDFFVIEKPRWPMHLV